VSGRPVSYCRELCAADGLLADDTGPFAAELLAMAGQTE
jgi:hypothetical protein